MASTSHIVKALLTRVIFAGHIIVSVWWVVQVTGQPQMWYLAFFDGVLFLETVFSVFYRKGQEYIWFSPSIFFHLAGIIPCAWILELHLLTSRENGTTANTVNPAVVEVSAERWTDLIEQTTMLMMILGRWLLPTARGMTKDSLSQLLLINLAMSADIIEFFDILKLEFVRSSQTLIISILCLWTWSLMQFPFNTMSKLDDNELNDAKQTKANQISPGRSHDAIFTPLSKNRTSMTSMDFKQAVAAKRMSRDILLMSHNYSRGLPRGYLPNQPQSGAPQLDDGIDVLRNNSLPEPTRDFIQPPDLLSLAANQSNGHQRGPGRFSLDVGQMRPKRQTGNMTTSMTSPNLRLDLLDKKVSEQKERNSLKGTEASPVHPQEHDTYIDVRNGEEETKKSRITTELVGILMSLFMQDGPFLTFRILIIAQHQAYQYMIIFLTVKNALVLALQVYRLCVLHCACYDHKENDFSPDNEIDANCRLKNVQVAVTHADQEESDSSSVHGTRWHLTGKWRTSLKNPLFYSRAFSRQSHIAHVP